MTRLVWEQINGSIIKSLWKEINEPSSDNSKLKDAMVALIFLKKRCYLKDRVCLPRAPDITTFLFGLDELQFKQEFCMSQNSFHQLVNEIKDHPIFHNNLSQSQLPVKDQLMVALNQMGSFGNGASEKAKAQRQICRFRYKKAQLQRGPLFCAFLRL
ncbi:hypothetical protein PCASD_02694 [Puccinia coronata f. sp. avenae]|uniref:Uncharacterized protein n=1 Tax=Puccinia coronata f. sp. avenae TaxID=200324 RepID=A0A2N5VH06_9BASI|nr:hypothetical protein PCASD_02694 [Puccinia coronata f. sp. avenae]